MAEQIRIALGSDHAGFALKQKMHTYLLGCGYQVEDHGTYSQDPVDYPDLAEKVAMRVAEARVKFGILFCGAGAAMAMAANKVAGVGAAACVDTLTARLSREHNDANVLALGGRTLDEIHGAQDRPDLARNIFRERRAPAPFGQTRCSGAAAVHKPLGEAIMNSVSNQARTRSLEEVDSEIARAIDRETERQSRTLELIASENFVSEAVLEALGSVMTNKYAEGLPGKRYYGGCEFVDVAEALAIERAKKLFEAEHVNIQPHSGAQANQAVYMTVLKPGDTLLGMNLAHGGHLTHGHPLNFSGKMYKIVPYGVSKETETIDYAELERLAVEHRPKLIIAGASAYPRLLDFERFAAIARGCGALLMVDMAHIAGLVAAGLHPSPFPHADFVTTTTHKTLRGPRGGAVFSKAQHAKELDKIVFPGIQGGPLMHVIAAKAVCFQEALQPEFRQYQEQVIANARALCETLSVKGFRIVSGGTDNHLMLVDVFSRKVTGKQAEKALESAGITVNKNAIPFDENPPATASGIRIGTPAVTSRGMAEAEMRQIGLWIAEVLQKLNDEGVAKRIRGEVEALTDQFPLYENRREHVAKTA